jgi:hypothetical protein
MGTLGQCYFSYILETPCTQQDNNTQLNSRNKEKKGLSNHADCPSDLIANMAIIDDSKQMVLAPSHQQLIEIALTDVLELKPVISRLWT